MKHRIFWVLSCLLLSCNAVFAAFQLNTFQFAELCSQGSPQEIRSALNAGANFNQDALIIAAANNPNPEVISILVNEAKKHGIDIINMRNSISGNSSALSEAMCSNNVNIVKTLLELGADPYMKINEGFGSKRTALEIAEGVQKFNRTNQRAENINFLRQYIIPARSKQTAQ